MEGKELKNRENRIEVNIAKECEGFGWGLFSPSKYHLSDWIVINKIFILIGCVL